MICGKNCPNYQKINNKRQEIELNRIDNISNNESKDSFTDHIGGYSYSNSWCRTYNNGITSTEDEYGNLRFSNGEYATRTSDGYYYFSNGITGYEDSYGDIHLSNGQVIIKK